MPRVLTVTRRNPADPAWLCLLKTRYALSGLKLLTLADRLLAMLAVLISVYRTVRMSLRSRAVLQLEILALGISYRSSNGHVRDASGSRHATASSGSGSLEPGRSGEPPS